MLRKRSKHVLKEELKMVRVLLTIVRKRREWLETINGPFSLTEAILVETLLLLHPHAVAAEMKGGLHSRRRNEDVESWIVTKKVKRLSRFKTPRSRQPGLGRIGDDWKWQSEFSKPVLYMISKVE